MTAAKRGPGRPEIGKRRQVVLDDESAAILIELGAGNLSAGIRAAAAILTALGNGDVSAGIRKAAEIIAK